MHVGILHLRSYAAFANCPRRDSIACRSDQLAGLLGLRFVQFREVRLDSVQPQPFMQPRLAMTSSAAMAPPVAEAEDVPVSASVEADVELRAP